MIASLHSRMYFFPPHRFYFISFYFLLPFFPLLVFLTSFLFSLFFNHHEIFFGFLFFFFLIYSISGVWLSFFFFPTVISIIINFSFLSKGLFPFSLSSRDFFLFCLQLSVFIVGIEHGLGDNFFNGETIGHFLLFLFLRGR